MRFEFSFRACLCALFFSAVCFSAPQTFETYGDSLTVGFLSATNLTEDPPLSLITDIYNAIFQWKLLGDVSSIEPYQKPELSWPVQLASQVESQPNEITVINNAVSGNKSSDLLAEVTGAQFPKPDSVAFFFIGHNDFCDNSDSPEMLAASFINNYNLAIAAWEKQHQGATAYFMPIGDIPRVFSTLDGFEWHTAQDGSPKLTCYDSWTRLFPYCPRYAHMQEAGQLGNYLSPRINAMNSALEKQVAQWDKQSGKNRYFYLKGVDQAPFQDSYFAIDCFHLSATGQKELASHVFDKVKETNPSSMF